MASTAWVPWNLSWATPTVYLALSVVMVLLGLLMSGLISRLPPELGCMTTQIAPPGPILASSRSPKLGAGARSTAEFRTPLPSEEAVAISAPIGPLSDAVMSCIHTRVTSPAELTTTCRPSADEGASPSPEVLIVWTPFLHFLAPLGRVQR